MLNERERRLLEALERQVSAEDPSFAHRLACCDPWTRWRAVGRWMRGVPALILAVTLAIAALALQLSSLGVLFLGWALIGAIARHVIASRRDAGPTGSATGHHGDRAGWS